MLKIRFYVNNREGVNVPSADVSYKNYITSQYYDLK